MEKVTSWNKEDRGYRRRARPGLVSGFRLIAVIACALFPMIAFAGTTEHLFSFNPFDEPTGTISYPSSVDYLGRICIADSEFNVVRCYLKDGSFLTGWGAFGRNDAQFIYPAGITTSASGFVYVADMYNHRIQKFQTDGTFVAKWGTFGIGNGQFSHPAGITIDKEGSVYIVDTYNYRVQKFNSDGAFVTKWGSRGGGEGQFENPAGIHVDEDGVVYVVDSGNHRIQLFKSDGTYISQLGSRGSEDGCFMYPRSIVTDSKGFIYVADTYNYRIQRFRNDHAFDAKWETYNESDRPCMPLELVADAAGFFWRLNTGEYRSRHSAMCKIMTSEVFGGGAK